MLLEHIFKKNIFSKTKNILQKEGHYFTVLQIYLLLRFKEG